MVSFARLGRIVHQGIALNHFWFKAILLAVALVWLPASAMAEGGADDVWQTFTMHDGLPSNSASAAMLGQDGSLWVGTDSGAGHYTGVWQSLGQVHGLPAGRVRAIAQSPGGKLWFGTEQGLARCDLVARSCSVWTMADGLPSSDVRAIVTEGDEGIWVGTAKGLAYVENRPSALVSPLAALNGTPIWALLIDRTGDQWIGTEGRGLWKRHAGNVSPIPAPDNTAGGSIYALFGDEAGRMWAGTDRGLVYYAAQKWQTVALNSPAGAGVTTPSGPRVTALALDQAGTLWAAGDSGCYGLTLPTAPQVAQPITVTAHLTAKNGLPSDDVRALVVDGDGALWLGTAKGVSRYSGTLWQVAADSPVGRAQINALLTDRAGRTWAGSENNGLAMWDGSHWRALAAQDGFTGQRVLALFEDNRGRIWAGTGTGTGYVECQIPACTGSRWRFFGPADGLPDAPVWSIGQDATGRLWFGANAGVAWWDESGRFQPVSQLTGLRVNAIHRSQDDALWFGTNDNGVLRLAGGQWQILPAEQMPFKSVALNGIAEQSNGTLWVGTYDSGLWRLSERGWQQPDDGPAGGDLLNVTYVNRSLWVGTGSGFSRFDGETWQSYSGGALPERQVRAVALGQNGTYWIGTSAGLVRYHPEHQPPWVKVESINLVAPQDGQVVLQNDTLRDVRLAGGDLATRAEDLIYTIDLDGQPLQMQSSRLISFRNLKLKPGDYMLRVWARDQSLNYSVPAEVTIRVTETERAHRVALPWGGTLPAKVFYPGLATSFLFFCGLAAVGGANWRARTQPREIFALQAEEPREPVARRFNPYISGEPVRTVGMFFGRQELLHKIINALHQNSIMIHGERRIGKTSLLYQLAEQLRQSDDAEWAFIPVYVDLEGTPQDRFFYLLMEEIKGTLQSYLQILPSLRFDSAFAGAYRDRDFTADLRSLLELVSPLVHPRNVRLILLMDEMDVVNTYNPIVQQQLRRIFMTSLSRSLGAVVAGVQISKTWERMESPWYNLFNEIPLEPLPDAEARRLLVDPVAGMYEWTPNALQFVLDRAHGRPFRLQQYGLEAVNYMLAANRTSITLEDVEKAEAVVG